MSPGAALLDALDRMNCAGLQLDGSGDVRRFNSVAARCLERHAGARGARQNGWASGALRQLLGGALAARKLKVPVAMPNVSERPVIAYTVPLPDREDRSSKVLALLDLGECLRPSPEMLRQVFDLTNAEARLAARLACGERLHEIAEAHGIGIGTARMHLKGIFAKTNACRQAEFVAMASRLSLAPLLECLAELIALLADSDGQDRSVRARHGAKQGEPIRRHFGQRRD